MRDRWVVPWNAYRNRLHARGSIQEPQIGQNLLYMYIAMYMGISARTHSFYSKPGCTFWNGRALNTRTTIG